MECADPRCLMFRQKRQLSRRPLQQGHQVTPDPQLLSWALHPPHKQRPSPSHPLASTPGPRTSSTTAAGTRGFVGQQAVSRTLKQLANSRLSQWTVAQSAVIWAMVAAWQGMGWKRTLELPGGMLLSPHCLLSPQRLLLTLVCGSLSVFRTLQNLHCSQIWFVYYWLAPLPGVALVLSCYHSHITFCHVSMCTTHLQ